MTFALNNIQLLLCSDCTLVVKWGKITENYKKIRVFCPISAKQTFYFYLYFDTALIEGKTHFNLTLLV